MNNKDSFLLSEAYTLVLEAKKKLTAKQKELAAAAEPYDKITRGDIITMAKKKKSLKEDATSVEQAYNQQDEVAAKKIADKLKGTPNLNVATIKMYVAKYLPMVGKGEKDVDHLTALVHDNLSELGLVEAAAGIEDQEEEAPVAHTVNLNNGDTVSWKGSSYRVEDVMGGTFKLIPVS
jgi:hypothetical protein